MKYKGLINRMDDLPLNSIPYHKNIDGISRLFPTNFPLHLAVHKIDDIKKIPIKYVKLHKHIAPEINIILGEGLEYKIQLEKEIYFVKSPVSIWVPKGLKHSANVVKGSGYYICLILTDKKSAFKEF